MTNQIFKLTPSTSITSISWSSILTPKVAIPETLIIRSLYVFPGLKLNVALTWSLIKPDSKRKIRSGSDKPNYIIKMGGGRGWVTHEE